MNPITNPFAPGAGTPPPELAGRDELRKTIHIAMERSRLGFPSKSILMVGLRGVGKTVLLETSGSLPIKEVDKRVHIVMDLKCPSSKMEKKNLYENISFLKPSDEVKFVIGNRNDYEWTKEKITELKIDKKAKILISPVFGEIEPKEIVTWILEDNLNARFQLQMHKYIWEPNQRGV